MRLFAHYSGPGADRLTPQEGSRAENGSHSRKGNACRSSQFCPYRRVGISESATHLSVRPSSAYLRANPSGTPPATRCRARPGRSSSAVRSAYPARLKMVAPPIALDPHGRSRPPWWATRCLLSTGPDAFSECGAAATGRVPFRRFRSYACPRATGSPRTG